MRPRDQELALQLDGVLTQFGQNQRELPGIAEPAAREAFIEQLVESVRRVSFPSKIAERPISERRGDPDDELFDPLRAAILFQRVGAIEEAYWMVFLFVHFGEHPKAGWRYARQLFGRLGDHEKWDWANVSSDPTTFSAWMDDNIEAFKADGPHGFGNHRKYESLGQTGTVVESYVEWVAPPRTHEELVSEALTRSEGDAREAFADLHKNMNVARFGRTARFDYLTTIGRVGLSPIEPDSAYMSNSTGPLEGARMFFGTDERPTSLDDALTELDAELHVGMHVLEDALCNWQKSPSEFRPYRS